MPATPKMNSPLAAISRNTSAVRVCSLRVPASKNRQVGIERLDVRAHALDQRRDAGGAAGVEHHARLIRLQKRQIDVRPRRFVDPRVLDVARDANHRAPLARRHANTLADGVRRATPESRASVSLTMATGIAVASSRLSNSRPATSPILQRAEVVGRDDVREKRQVLVPARRVAIDCHLPGPVIDQRQRRGSSPASPTRCRSRRARGPAAARRTRGLASRRSRSA